jgi:hypothetical protein
VNNFHFSGIPTVTKAAIRGQRLDAMNRPHLLSAALAPLLLAGCLNVKTEPIEVKPIHITVDVNVKVERALDDFFGDLDKKSATIAPHEETK